MGNAGICMLIGMTVWGWIRACSVLGKNWIGFMCTFLMWCSCLSHDSSSPTLEKTNNHGECGRSKAGEAQARLGGVWRGLWCLEEVLGKKKESRSHQELEQWAPNPSAEGVDSSPILCRKHPNFTLKIRAKSSGQSPTLFPTLTSLSSAALTY